MNLKQPVELYVNFKGEVRCRPLQLNDTNNLRIAFAFAAAFGPHIQRDKQGYPCFQGTRGVCSTIVGLCDHRMETVVSYRDEDDCTVTSVELRRRKKINLLAQISAGIGLSVLGIGALAVAAMNEVYFPSLDIQLLTVLLFPLLGKEKKEKTKS